MDKVYIGGDHRGFNQKEWLKEQLRDKGYQVIDLGAVNYDKDDDYTDIAFDLSEQVVKEKAFGILICGSGVGVCMAANKVKGARAALCTSQIQARKSRNDEDANILCLSAELVSEDDNLGIANTFLETIFSSEERYIRRIRELKQYESTT